MQQQREELIYPLHSLEKAIPNLSWSKLKGVSSRDAKNVRVGIVGEDVVSPSLEGFKRTLTDSSGEPGRTGSAMGQEEEEGDAWSPSRAWTHMDVHMKDMTVKSVCCCLKLLTHKFPIISHFYVFLARKCIV